MDQRLHNYYLESRVNNATPGQLLIMLYDGLIEHAEGADQAITSPGKPGDFGPAALEVSRCINILTELSTCLRPSFNPALCATLSDLYRFFTREFYQALEMRDAGKIRGILPLIRNLRKTWVEADRRANPFSATSVAVAA
jgi:flagellar protein FliS